LGRLSKPSFELCTGGRKIVVVQDRLATPLIIRGRHGKPSATGNNRSLSELCQLYDRHEWRKALTDLELNEQNPARARSLRMGVCFGARAS